MRSSSAHSPTAADYRLPRTPSFWLRLVKAPGGRLTVTNMQRGVLSESELDRTLVGLLDAHIDPEVRAIVFSELPLASGALDPESTEACRSFDLLSMIMRRWATGSGRGIDNGYLDYRGGLYSAVFELD